MGCKHQTSDSSVQMHNAAQFVSWYERQRDSLRMERSLLPALHYGLHPGWVCHAEDAVVRLLVRRADDGDRLGEHELVRSVRVQVERREKDGLRWVGVDLHSHDRRTQA